MVEVYDLFKREKINSFLYHGQGPEEVMILDGFQIDNDRLIIRDLSAKKMIQVDLNTINDTNIILKSFFNLKDYGESIMEVADEVAYIDDKWIVFRSNSNKGRIALMNKQDTIIKYCDPIKEKLFDELDDRRHNRLFPFNLTINVKNKKIATSTRTADILKIYEYSNEELVSIWHHNTFMPNNIQTITFEDTEPLAFFTQKSKMGYFDIISSDQYVYALFSGKSGEDKNPYYTNRIRVFDWNGDKKFELITNYEMKRITVDKNDNYLYGISTDENGSPIIVSFNLKGNNCF